jgi:hypothetical protein
MASIEPVALDPMVRWWLESTTTTVITGHRIATGESTALLVYTALVALVLMGQQSSVGPIKPLLSQREVGAPVEAASALDHRQDAVGRAATTRQRKGIQPGDAIDAQTWQASVKPTTESENVDS